MGLDLGPVLGAIAATIGSIVAGALVARRLARAGLSDEQLRVNATLRELADVETAKRGLLQKELDASTARLTDTRNALDDCARQRDNAYSELRNVRRRRTTRPEP